MLRRIVDDVTRRKWSSAISKIQKLSLVATIKRHRDYINDCIDTLVDDLATVTRYTRKEIRMAVRCLIAHGDGNLCYKAREHASLWYYSCLRDIIDGCTSVFVINVQSNAHDNAMDYLSTQPLDHLRYIFEFLTTQAFVRCMCLNVHWRTYVRRHIDQNPLIFYRAECNKCQPLPLVLIKYPYRHTLTPYISCHSLRELDLLQVNRAQMTAITVPQLRILRCGCVHVPLITAPELSKLEICWMYEYQRNELDDVINCHNLVSFMRGLPLTHVRMCIDTPLEVMEVLRTCGTLQFCSVRLFRPINRLVALSGDDIYTPIQPHIDLPPAATELTTNMLECIVLNEYVSTICCTRGVNSVCDLARATRLIKFIGSDMSTHLTNIPPSLMCTDYKTYCTNNMQNNPNVAKVICQRVDFIPNVNIVECAGIHSLQPIPPRLREFYAYAQHLTEDDLSLLLQQVEVLDVHCYTRVDADFITSRITPRIRKINIRYDGGSYHYDSLA